MTDLLQYSYDLDQDHMLIVVDDTKAINSSRIPLAIKFFYLAYQTHKFPWRLKIYKHVYNSKLKIVHCTQQSPQYVDADYQYDDTQVTAIISNKKQLYLAGSMAMSNNEYNVTHILNVGNNECKYTNSEAEVIHYPISESADSDYILDIYHTVGCVNSILNSNGSLIVHCAYGRNRSPMIIIAYLIKYLKMSLEDAYIFVKRRRPSIGPSINCMIHLMKYEYLQRRR